MKSILLVEDDPFLSDIYLTKLKQSGFEVLAVSEGKECLRKLKEKNFDLVILDIVLPHWDGWEIMRKIKKAGKDVKSKNLKIIILSNLGQKEDIEKGLKLGAVKYLIKAHYTPTEVVKEIKKILIK